MEAPPDSKRALNIDSRPNQIIQHQNPIEKYRQVTDKTFLCIYPVIIVIWLIVCILGFIAPQHHDYSTVDRILTLYQWCINAPIHRFSVGFIAAIIITILVVCLSTLLSLKFTKFFINIGLGLFILSTIAYLYQAIAGSAYGLSSIGFFGVISKIASVLYTWFTELYMICAAYCYLKADKSVLCELAKDAYQAIARSPPVIIFVGLITILTALIFSFTFNSFMYDIFAVRNAILADFFILVILFGGICALSFLPCLAVVVVTEYAIDYYWKRHDNTSPSVGHSIANALRNHIGTMMFASTAFVASIVGIIQAIKHKRTWQLQENIIFYIVSKIYLAVRMPEIALIFTSIYGTDYVNSAQKAFDVVLRRCPLFLATLAACEAIIVFPALLAMILSLLTLVIDPVGDVDSVEGTKKIALIIHGLIYPLIMFIFLVWLTMKALLINKIIMLNKEEQDTQGKVHILNQP